MSRKRVGILVFGAGLVLTATAAHSADYSPPQPVIIPQPVIEEYSAWYLRGDIGFTNQSVRNLTNIQDVNNSVQDFGDGFDASPLFGIGVGYYFNDWMRFDVTGEYRSKANFHSTQVITSNSGTITDEYSASKSEWLFLANAYIDLGTWNNFTPFVGAGVGMSRNTISSFRDVCTVCAGGGVAFADDASKWNFAWALHAGVAYKISKDLSLELSYRYVDLGDAQSGDIFTYLGQNNINNPMMFHHLTSQDVRLGLRMNFEALDFGGHRQYYAPPPVYAPPPQYAPQPQYQYAPQPQMQSRG